MIIFIVGVGRSGTSLLQSMVASHPAISALPETSFLRRYVFSTSRHSSDFSKDAHLKRIPLLIDSLHERGTSQSGLLESYLDVVNHQDKSIVLDKDPRLIEYIPLLLKNFTNCKVIHIYRDPRDVLASKKNAAWSSGRSLISYLVAADVQLNAASKYESNNHVYSICYEELIRNPEKSLRKLCRFIDLSFHRSLLDHTLAAKRLVNHSELSWKKETFMPVKADNYGKWRSQLSGLEAASVEKVSDWSMQKGRYETTYQKLSFSLKIAVQGLVLLTGALSVIYLINHNTRVRRNLKSSELVDES